MVKVDVVHCCSVWLSALGGLRPAPVLADGRITLQPSATREPGIAIAAGVTEGFELSRVGVSREVLAPDPQLLS